MKKNFFKKLASGLALAMVVTSFAPAAPALAATATKIVKQGGAKAPTTVYVGKKVDYSLNKVYGTNSYKWFTSNAAVAKVTKTGGVVTPVAAGKATIKVNAYKKSTGKFVKSFTLKLDVKQRATSVEIGAEDFELAVGETKDLNAVKTPATSTDTLRYFSSDEKVATVNLKTGVVTAVAAGEATIKVASKGAWFTSNTSKYNKYDEVKVTVVDGIQSIKQLTPTKFDVVFATDQSKALTKENITITDANGVKQVVKGVTFSTDGKTVTVEVFVPLADKVTYKVAYADSALDFVASKGDVAKIVVNSKTVKFGAATPISVRLYDANGVDVTTDTLLSDRVTFEYDSSKAYIEDYDTTNHEFRITVFNYPETIAVKAIYHTYTYGDNAVENTFESAAVINSVEKLPNLAKDIEYTLGTTADWDKVTTTIPADALNYQLFIKAKDENGKDITEADFDFESTDISVLTVSDAGANVYVYPVKAGTVYIKATYGDTVKMLAVTVGAEAKVSSVVPDKTTVTLYDSLLSETQSVTITVKDQYGKESNYSQTILPEFVSGSSESIINASATGNKVTFNLLGVVNTSDSGNANKDNAGNNTFKLTYYDRVVYVTVKVVDVDTSLPTSYINIDRPVTEKDAVLKTSTVSGSSVTFTVYGYNTAGAPVATVAPDSYVVKFNGTAIYDSVNGAIANDKTNATVDVSQIANGKIKLVVLDTNGTPVSQAAVGTYTIEAIKNNVDHDNNTNTATVTRKATSSVVVKNSQVAPVVSRKASVVSAGTVKDVIKAGLTIKINGTAIDNDTEVVATEAVVGSSATTDLYESVNAKSSVVIKTVTVKEVIGGKTIYHKVNVNLSFVIGE